MSNAITIELYRIKRRWGFDVVREGQEHESVLSGGDGFFDRLSQFGERMIVEIGVEESGQEGELALVSVEGSDLRGWRLFRKRDAEESGMLSPDLLQFFGSTKVLFVKLIPTAEEVAE